MSSTFDNEIDLFEVFKVLWDGKRLIGAFIALSVLLSGGFIAYKEEVYESKLVYTIETVPPFLSR